MKNLLFAVALLFSVTSFAMPKVGDYARYELTASNSTESVTGYMEMELVSKGGVVSFKQVVTMNGQIISDTSTAVDLNQLTTDAQIDNILANCAQASGVTEMLNVGGQYMQTCTIKTADSNNPVNISYSKVPFGMSALSYSYNGTQVSMTLKEFRFGN